MKTILTMVALASMLLVQRVEAGSGVIFQFSILGPTQAEQMPAGGQATGVGVIGNDLDSDPFISFDLLDVTCFYDGGADSDFFPESVITAGLPEIVPFGGIGVRIVPVQARLEATGTLPCRLHTVGRRVLLETMPELTAFWGLGVEITSAEGALVFRAVDSPASYARTQRLAGVRPLPRCSRRRAAQVNASAMFTAIGYPTRSGRLKLCRVAQ